MGSGETNGTGSSGRELADLLNTMLFEIRKQFGMYAQIQWSVTDVAPDAITIRVEMPGGRGDGADTARNIRNAILGVLRGMVACSTFRAIVHMSTTPSAGEEHVLPFHEKGATTVPLPSSAILIEENLAPFREEWRPRIEAAWSRVVLMAGK